MKNRVLTSPLPQDTSPDVWWNRTSHCVVQEINETRRSRTCALATVAGGRYIYCSVAVFCSNVLQKIRHALNLMTTPHGRFNGYASCPPRMWVHSLGGVRPSHSTRIIWHISHYAIGAILWRTLTLVISDFGEVGEIWYRRRSASEVFGFLV